MSKKYRIRVEFGVYVTALQLVIQVPVLPVSVESRGFNPIFNRPVFGGGLLFGFSTILTLYTEP